MLKILKLTVINYTKWKVNFSNLCGKIAFPAHREYTVDTEVACLADVILMVLYNHKCLRHRKKGNSIRLRCLKKQEVIIHKYSLQENGTLHNGITFKLIYKYIFVCCVHYVLMVLTFICIFYLYME